jgi:hypothetical protein
VQALTATEPVAVLTGCAVFTASAFFFTQERKYVVEATSSLTPEVRRDVFESFEDYWVKNGYTPLFPRREVLSRSATFRIPPIGSGREGWAQFADLLKITQTEGQDMVLEVLRYTVLPTDFSESELSNFVTQVEATIREASGHQVRLRLLRTGT